MALQEEGGLGQPDHVGESIVVVNAENCTKIEVVCCTAARAGALLNMLTGKYGVGVNFGTITSLLVASSRPNPAQLLQEFKALKNRLEENYKPPSSNSNERPQKFEYVVSTSVKSIEELWNEICDLSHDNNDYYISVACAGVISAVGLMTNSPVVTLSAMLISPLMGPILSMSFGLAVGDMVLFRSGLISELRGALATFLFGILISLLFGRFFNTLHEFPTSEMEGRGEAYGLVSSTIVAIASGVVIGNAVTSSGINSLVGVAISASLLPPIVNSGILLVFYFMPCEQCNEQNTFLKQAGISLCLYILNVIIIATVSYNIFISQKLNRFGSGLASHQSVLDLSNPQVLNKLKLAAGLQKYDQVEIDKLSDIGTSTSKSKSINKHISKSKDSIGSGNGNAASRSVDVGAENINININMNMNDGEDGADEDEDDPFMGVKPIKKKKSTLNTNTSTSTSTSTGVANTNTDTKLSTRSIPSAMIGVELELTDTEVQHIIINAMDGSDSKSQNDAVDIDADTDGAAEENSTTSQSPRTKKTPPKTLTSRESEYSIFRPFDEPVGVARAKFASEVEAAQAEQLGWSFRRFFEEQLGWASTSTSTL